MKHLNRHTRRYEHNERVDAFLADLLALFDKHKLVLRHVDDQGEFIITNRHKRSAIKHISATTFDIEQTDHGHSQS